MTGYRLAPVTMLAPRSRQPRVNSESHLAFIRQLPCVITGTRPVDPAHLRAGNRLLGKREVGVAEKADDKWTTPLSRAAHDEQHSMNELIWWRSYGIENPWQLCLALWACSGDLEKGEAIVAQHRMIVRR